MVSSWHSVQNQYILAIVRVQNAPSEPEECPNIFPTLGQQSSAFAACSLLALDIQPRICDHAQKSYEQFQH